MFSKAVPINLVENKRMALGRVIERIARPKTIFEYVRLFTAYILLIILWASNHYDFPYHDLVGYILVVGVLVGILGDRVDSSRKK